MLSLLLVALLAPPPDWTALAAPGTHNVARLAFSPDGARIGVCAEDRLVIVARGAPEIRVVEKSCGSLAFAEGALYFSVRYPAEGEATLWRYDGALHPLPAGSITDLLGWGGGLLVAEEGGLVRWAKGARGVKQVLPGVRRLAARPGGGVLAITANAVLLLDPTLKRERTLTPTPAPGVNGIYHALELPDGAVIAVDNAGSLWRWGPDGAPAAHQLHAGSGRAIAFDGRHVVVGDAWFDPQTLAVVHRDGRLPRADGPVVAAPDRATLAHPVHGGVILRPSAWKAHPVRGLPYGGRGLLLAGDGLVVGDEGGGLVWFDAQGRALRREPIARDALRQLVGDPARAIYALTEWGGVVARRADGSLRRWEVRSGEALQLSADGATLIVGGQRHAWRIDTRTGAQVALAETKDHHTFAPIFAPDGGVLLFADDLPTRWWKPDGTVTTWPHQGRSGGFDRRGRLWRIAREGSGIHAWPGGAVLAPLEHAWPSEIIALADGGVLATGWEGSVIRYTAEGAERWRKAAPWHVGGAALRGTTLYTAGPDLAVQAWDVATGARRRWAPPGRGEAVTGLEFSADSARLAVAYDYGGARIWDRAAHAMIRELPLTEVSDVELSRSATAWLVRTHRTAHVWPMGAAAPAIARALDLGDDGWLPRETRHAGRFLFVPTAPSGRVVDLETGAVVWRPVVPAAVGTTAVSADGQRVAIAGGEAGDRLTIQVRGVAPLRGPAGRWEALAWQGDTLWCVGEDAIVRWRNGRKVPFSKDLYGSELAFGAQRVALASGAVVSVFEGDRRIATLPTEQYGQQMALSPDGRWLATGGRHSGSVVLWSVDDGRAVARYEAFGDGVWRATTADGVEKTGPTFPRAWR